MYTKEELGFILYNNRSVNGVVSNFIPKNIDPLRLIRLENIFDSCKEEYSDDRMVEIDYRELDIDAPDEIVTIDQLSDLTDIVTDNIGNFSESEYEFLINRGIGEDTILKWNMLGLSSIKEYEHMRRLGTTCHPVLKKILEDGIEEGGILIPLFENKKLINCAVRKISDVGKLKYSLACPDIPVWGLDDIEGQEVWITEGLFDMMALRKMGKKSVSCSSAIWSGIQLYKLIKKEPSSIVIFSDNDKVGLRVSAILKSFFDIYQIPTKTVISNIAKDPSEHYFQKDRNLSDITEITITKEMIGVKEDNSFNFLKHLKNRKF